MEYTIIMNNMHYLYEWTTDLVEYIASLAAYSQTASQSRSSIRDQMLIHKDVAAWTLVDFTTEWCSDEKFVVDRRSERA